MANQQITDEAKNVTNKVKDTAATAKNKVEDVTKSIMDATTNTCNDFIELVKKNPIKSISLAALCGLVIAKIIKS